MFTTISRIINFGLKNFWRNGLLSTATVAVTAIALLVTLGLMTFNFVTGEAISSVKDKIDISVYFKTTTAEDNVLSIQKVVESLPEVKQVEYINKDEALKRFKEQHKDDSISQAISLLNENPLEASLNIKAKSPELYGAIAQSLQADAIKQYVDKISYSENKVIIDKLTKIIDNVNQGGLVLVIFLAIVSGLIVFNTIRLAIYSNRDEIGIMRAVGASNMLVRGPFLIDGVLNGTIAAVLSLILAIPIIHFVAPYLKSFIPGLDIANYFYGGLFRLFLLQLLFGVGISIVSSFLAVRRYLKN